MITLLSILIVIASIIMILLVLVQKSKGGGLSSNFSSSNQIMGVRKTTDFLEKATWTMAIVIIGLSVITANGISKSHQDASENKIEIPTLNNNKPVEKAKSTLSLPAQKPEEKK